MREKVATVNLDDLTLGQVKSLQAALGSKPACPMEVGKAYMFFGFSRYVLGRVLEVRGGWCRLCDAMWIATTAKHSEFFSGTIPKDAESETYGGVPVWVNTDGCNDIAEWPFELKAVVQ